MFALVILRLVIGSATVQSPYREDFFARFDGALLIGGVAISFLRRSRDAAAAIVCELIALGFDATRSTEIAPGRDATVFVTIQPRPSGPQGQAKLRAQRNSSSTRR